MKNLLLVLTLGACLTGSALAQSTNSAPSTPAPPKAGPPPGGHAWGMAALTPEEKEELMNDHKAVLAANPDLDDASKALAAKMKDLQEQQKDLNDKISAAMIKADPNAAPIIAKLQPPPREHPPGKAPDAGAAKSGAPAAPTTPATH